LFSVIKEARIRGHDQRSGDLFSYIDIEERIPAKYPLRIIRELVNEVLVSFSSDFEAMYSQMSRRSIPPEQLLRTLLYPARDRYLNKPKQLAWFGEATA